jgi:hypothetical protein
LAVAAKSERDSIVASSSVSIFESLRRLVLSNRNPSRAG